MEKTKKPIKAVPRIDGENTIWKNGEIEPVIPPKYRGSFQDKE